MKHKIGVIEGCNKGLSAVRQGVKVLEAISKNSNLSFDLRYIQIGAKPKYTEEDSAFSDAAENCKSLDAILVMDDIQNDEPQQLRFTSKAASVALQFELETKLFDSLEKYPIIFEADDSEDLRGLEKDVVKPLAAINSVAKLLDYVGYKRFGDKVRFAALEASVALKSKKSDDVTSASNEDQLTDMVVEYINKNIDEPMISAWGEI